MVLTAAPYSPRGAGLDSPRRKRIGSACLTPASGRQDHTAWPSASGTLVSRAISVHRIPLPTSVTIAKRPSDRDRDAQTQPHSSEKRKKKVFREGLDTTSDKTK